MKAGIFTAALLSAAVTAAVSTEKQEVCHALALSGGGSNGAWEAGVLWGFLNNESTNAEDFKYDVITGVSAGAINTMALAGWQQGRESEMVQWLSDLWANLHTSDVWVDWPLGKASGILLMGGAVDNSPLFSFLQHTVSTFSDYQRRVSLTSANVNTGVYTEFNQDNTNFKDLPEAALSSASIPVIFPQHVWKGRGVFMDGGTVQNINVESAIRQCLEIVDDESKIIIDALFCGAPDAPPSEPAAGNTWENYFRGRQLRTFYNDSNSIASALHAHPGVQMRYVIKQGDDGLGGLDQINFEGDFTWPLQETGRQQANDALTGNKSGANVRDTIVQWVTDESIHAQFPQVTDYITAQAKVNNSQALADGFILH